LAVVLIGSVLAGVPATSQTQKEPPAAPAQAESAAATLSRSPTIEDEKPERLLKTTSRPRRAPSPSETEAKFAVLPNDPPGIWVLNIKWKPLRIVALEDGSKRRKLYYMYYRMVNRTGTARRFAPRFTLVTDTGKHYEEIADLPQAVTKIQKREDPDVAVYSTADINGILRLSTREDVDETVTGVAIWENVDPHTDTFNIYVRGLSDGSQLLPAPGGDKHKQIIHSKTLRIDFIRQAAQGPLNGAIEAADPPYQWTYRGDGDSNQ
jgi:hypothetical protein